MKEYSGKCCKTHRLIFLMITYSWILNLWIVLMSSCSLLKETFKKVLSSFLKNLAMQTYLSHWTQETFSNYMHFKIMEQKQNIKWVSAASLLSHTCMGLTNYMSVIIRKHLSNPDFGDVHTGIYRTRIITLYSYCIAHIHNLTYLHSVLMGEV